VTAARLVLAPGELALLASLLRLELPPGFRVQDATGDRSRLTALGVLRAGEVQASVAAGLAAACAPRVGVLVAAAVGEVSVTAALGVRAEVGGSLARVGHAAVEASLWPAVGLGGELARLVPPAAGPGRLRATVVAPPDLVGQRVWFAHDRGWVTGLGSRPVSAADLASDLAPLIGAALA
jgi:hypothetical protein